MRRLFSERHGQGKPRTAEALDESTKTGLLGVVSALIDQDAFGLTFPLKCPDGTANSGCDTQSLRAVMAGYGLIWPPSAQAGDVSDFQVFDVIEFSYEQVAQPQKGGWHDSIDGPEACDAQPTP